MKKNLLITATLVLFLSTSCGHRVSDAITITVYTDSIVSDVSKHPVGINLNFIMDGGRFPKAKKNVTEAVKELGLTVDKDVTAIVKATEVMVMA